MNAENQTEQNQTTSSPDFADIDSLSYEEARDELVSVVTKLETGGAPLEESIALWERGEVLAARCEALLDGIKGRLDAARAAQQPE
ncbi:exodeoxyribonuclease VII small subunit [Falsarthrobacter nasiphocae]|uniref:Exodeoxyribonuclease 7 small subunit n=1 Tax=Falsarthrobacter nasiphocae TaxID=189863 RepID=A0AAE4C7L8_9MICC|nr:exodeoxyribonuclease VII small subunit [Falsarthrobacter nasiphocae]MDR6891565.1 exodeoxyribonuclease VII small subunit [Falsarthrobacter nasiphocae]